MFLGKPLDSRYAQILSFKETSYFKEMLRFKDSKMLKF